LEAGALGRRGAPLQPVGDPDQLIGGFGDLAVRQGMPHRDGADPSDGVRQPIERFVPGRAGRAVDAGKVVAL
jgi:hypothetical protein